MNNYPLALPRRLVATVALVFALVLALAAWGLPRLSAEAAPAQPPATTVTVAAHARGHQQSQAVRLTKPSQVIFHDQMRKLWEDHVTWTRLAIVTFADDSASFPATAERLLQNQADIGDAIKPYYGQAAGNQLTALLNDHILIAVDLLQAAEAGDTAAVTEARARWATNGDDIGNFLGTADPRNWPAPEMRAAMAVHLEQTFNEAANELGGNYAASVTDYDAAHLHMLDMADVLSNGIMQKFPKKFR